MTVKATTFMVLCWIVSASSKTFRYRNGVPNGESVHFAEETLSVSAARNRCNKVERCVSFSFASEGTRFPEGNITAFFYEYADWHVTPLNGEPCFVENQIWHTYVNTTREMKLVEPEINQVLYQLQSPSKLRGGSGSYSDRTMTLLQSLFDISVPKSHGPIAAPLITPYALNLASDASKPNILRLMSMKILILLGDSSETGKTLVSHGVFQAMKTVISERDEWDEIAINALNVIGNICYYRSANAELRKLGADRFLQSLLLEPGFAGLQAAMSLAHLGGLRGFLPQSMAQELVHVLESAVDGDPVHGILWDLVPGPLSAVQYYLEGPRSSSDSLLDAGLMEQLLRVLESDKSEELIATLEIMMSMSRNSERAKDMILQADHSVREIRRRLAGFQVAANLGRELSNLVLSLDSPRLEL
jgi:hypothetical protein